MTDTGQGGDISVVADENASYRAFLHDCPLDTSLWPLLSMATGLNASPNMKNPLDKPSSLWSTGILQGNCIEKHNGTMKTKTRFLTNAE